MRRREPLAAYLDAAEGHRDADRDLVRADPERAERADAVVAGQDEEYTHRERMTAARDDHGRGKRQDALGELEAHADHRVRVGAARAERAQVEASGEHAFSARQHDDAPVLRGAVERGVQLREHVRREDVHLAVVHRDRRDGIPELVTDQRAHGMPPLFGDRRFGTSIRFAPAHVNGPPARPLVRRSPSPAGPSQPAPRRAAGWAGRRARSPARRRPCAARGTPRSRPRRAARGT